MLLVNSVLEITGNTPCFPTPEFLTLKGGRRVRQRDDQHSDDDDDDCADRVPTSTEYRGGSPESSAGVRRHACGRRRVDSSDRWTPQKPCSDGEQIRLPDALSTPVCRGSFETSRRAAAAATDVPASRMRMAGRTLHNSRPKYYQTQAFWRSAR